MFSIKKTLLFTAATLASVQSTFAFKDYKKCIHPGDFALTFDDGPTSKYTEMVLDVLKKENVKATFFVNGKNCMDVKNDPKAQALIKREVKEGHIIASHTYTHPENGITGLTDKQLRMEMGDLNDLLYDLTGVKPAFFRPPLGEYTEQNKKVIERLGFTANIIWNLDSNDWRKGVNATENYLVKLEKANPKKDSFIALNHDIQKVTATHNLAIVIPIIRDLGYRFVTMDECLGISAYQNKDSLSGKNMRVEATDRQINTSNNNTLTTPPVNTTVPANTTVPFDNTSNLQTSGVTFTKSVSLISYVILISLTLLNIF